MGTKPQGPPPIYEPAVVANAILYAAAHPVRDVYAGGAARVRTLMQRLSPELVDVVLSSDRLGFAIQRTDVPRDPQAPGELVCHSQ